MISRRILTTSVLALAGMLIPAASAVAQNAHVATVNPGKVFNDMQETKDLKQKLEAESKAIQDRERALVSDFEEAKKKVVVFQPGSKEASEAQRGVIEKAIGLRTWQELTKADLQRNQKAQMRDLFKKIEVAVKEVADAEKFDLVITHQEGDLPDNEQITVDQLRAIINQKNVMYSNGKFDITQKVITVLDTKYKQGK